METDAVHDAELDHQVEPWGALTQLVVRAVALLLDQLPLFAHLHTHTHIK